jgi:hypothetical protein
VAGPKGKSKESAPAEPPEPHLPEAWDCSIGRLRGLLGKLAASTQQVRLHDCGTSIEQALGHRLCGLGHAPALVRPFLLCYLHFMLPAASGVEILRQYCCDRGTPPPCIALHSKLNLKPEVESPRVIVTPCVLLRPFLPSPAGPQAGWPGADPADGDCAHAGGRA